MMEPFLDAKQEPSEERYVEIWKSTTSLKTQEIKKPKQDEEEKNLREIDQGHGMSAKRRTDSFVAHTRMPQKAVYVTGR